MNQTSKNCKKTNEHDHVKQSRTVIDGEKSWAKNGNDESRSAQNGNGMVTGQNQRHYCNKNAFKSLQQNSKII